MSEKLPTVVDGSNSAAKQGADDDKKTRQQLTSVHAEQEDEDDHGDDGKAQASAPSRKLGDHIKAIEAAWESRLPPEQPFVIRLDGHGFSKVTRMMGFAKPCDERMLKAMIQTTTDLVQEFNAVLGFTQSDEISLVFPAVCTAQGQTHMYSGRIQKLASLSAGFATRRFNYHLKLQGVDVDDEKNKTATVEIKDKDAQNKKQLINLGADTADTADVSSNNKKKKPNAYFDARVFACPTPEDAMLAVYWRHRYDCYKNGVSALAQCHFPHKALENKNTTDKIAMLKDRKGIVLDTYPPALFYGTFVKKEQFEVVATSPNTCSNSNSSSSSNSGAATTSTTVLRSRCYYGSFAWRGTKEQRTHFTFAKYGRVIKLSGDCIEC